MFGAWLAIEMDFQEWGIDLESGILKERSWRWFEVRIAALLDNQESRLFRVLLAKEA